MSIRKRVAGIGVGVALIAAVAGPVSVAGASPGPALTPAAMVTPTGPFQAGADAAIGGWNAGAEAAVGGFNAGAAALGLPFQFTVNPWGPLEVAGVAPLTATP